MTENTGSLFEPRLAYKPFSHPWAFEAFVQSEQMHWLVREVPLNEDVKDWKTRLTEAEKNLLTQIFRFFTTADIDVASGYIDRYLPVIKPVELRMMMTSIAAREAVHIHAYSTLIDEVGIPETEYAAFMDYAAMRDKHDFMFQQQKTGDDKIDLAKDIAVFSAFGEGMQLFSSFVILLNFTRFGKCKGMGQIVAWSIRDESHHVDSMLKLFHALLEELPYIWTDEFKKGIYETCRDMVALEDRFIDLAFEQGGIEGVTPDEVKSYIRYIADRRLLQLGLKANYGIDENPLPWVDVIVSGKEHTNFFENKATDYAKGATTGSWEDVDWGDETTEEQNADREFLPQMPLEYGTGGNPPPPYDLVTDGEWLIMTKPGCPSCVNAKNVLKIKGAIFEEKIFETDDEIAEFKALGYRTFPQIVHYHRDEPYKGEHVGGYEALLKYLS